MASPMEAAPTPDPTVAAAASSSAADATEAAGGSKRSYEEICSYLTRVTETKWRIEVGLVPSE